MRMRESQRERKIKERERKRYKRVRNGQRETEKEKERESDVYMYVWAYIFLVLRLFYKYCTLPLLRDILLPKVVKTICVTSMTQIDLIKNIRILLDLEPKNQHIHHSKKCNYKKYTECDSLTSWYKITLDAWTWLSNNCTKNVNINVQGTWFPDILV